MKVDHLEAQKMPGLSKFKKSTDSKAISNLKPSQASESVAPIEITDRVIDQDLFSPVSLRKTNDFS